MAKTPLGQGGQKATSGTKRPTLRVSRRSLPVLPLVPAEPKAGRRADLGNRQARSAATVTLISKGLCVYKGCDQGARLWCRVKELAMGDQARDGPRESAGHCQREGPLCLRIFLPTWSSLAGREGEIRVWSGDPRTPWTRSVVCVGFSSVKTPLAFDY